jgi:hypothetical protein
MAEKSGFDALKTGSALLKKGTFPEKMEQWAVVTFCVDIENLVRCSLRNSTFVCNFTDC